MVWFRLDDSFHSHPKVVAAGNEAVGLYVRCGTYAAQHLTDGFIPEHIVRSFGGLDVRRGADESLAETLVKTRLWRRARGGWRMPDYLDYNPSKESVDNERKSKAERQKRWREARSRRVTNASRNASRDVAPTRPDPTPTGSGSVITTNSPYPARDQERHSFNGDEQGTCADCGLPAANRRHNGTSTLRLVEGGRQ